MNKFVELPLLEPLYATYHNQGPSTAIIVNNPSIKNWYLNQIMNLTCNRKFLSGFTTPEITISDSSWYANPFLDKIWYPMQFAKGSIHSIIREMLNQGYYVAFMGIDDYYVEGKSWYKERHFNHDGLICGYNQEDKTYCIFAYDSKWVYQKFWTSQKAFEQGRKAAFRNGVYGSICGLKVKEDRADFSPKTTCFKIQEYLDSNLKKYPFDGEGDVFGIVVHEYIAKYVTKLMDGSISYERMDRRVFRMIWEHKKVMLERIMALETSLQIGEKCSTEYKSVVEEANTMRMLYASYHMKQRDSLLPVIQRKLLAVSSAEREILTALLGLAGKELAK